jgi:hypothetical protein
MQKETGCCLLTTKQAVSSTNAYDFICEVPGSNLSQNIDNLGFTQLL